MSSTSPAPSQGAPAINPLQIALAFIKQYYKVLSTNNSLIHKFYKPESRISFSENCYSTAETHSFADIDEKTFAWASNSKVDLANGSIDAQESVGGTLLGTYESIFHQNFLINHCKAHFNSHLKVLPSFQKEIFQ